MVHNMFPDKIKVKDRMRLQMDLDVVGVKDYECLSVAETNPGKAAASPENKNNEDNASHTAEKNQKKS